MLATTFFTVVSLLLASFTISRQATFLKYASGRNKHYGAAVQFLWKHDAKLACMENKLAKASWNYSTNLTEENKKVLIETQVEAAKFDKQSWKNATSFAWKHFEARNETVYRWFKRLSVLGTAALSKSKLKKLKSIIADMKDAYGKAKVCSKTYPADKPCDLELEPELNGIFKKSRDYYELEQLWSDWRAATGKKLKTKFLQYVKLSNEAARLNGFRDAGEFWRDDYETNTFQKDVKKLWKEVEPFYKQLHAYVRRKLIEQYPDKGILPNGPIPAHLLGNMWGQTWSNIFSIVVPFPKKNSPATSKNIFQENMTPLDMFKLAEKFFVSLGLKPMTSEFWKNSIIEKPKDREIICHASAFDFSDGKDFRIKMCTKVDMEDFITVHHEMGHIEYYQLYAHQPIKFREGANPGFHEAIGDVMALSVSTSKHLRKIGFYDDHEEDNETAINSLMVKALGKVAFLPYSYLLDRWRWKVFNGEYSEDLNSKWWEERLKYQGICPPVRRTNDDLDAASKYHVISDTPYIRYFVSHIIEFQFHKALCDAAGHVGPLHECDIYQNKEAGRLLRETLSLGCSVHWKEAMNIITRGETREMDAQPLLEYFEPLIRWLKKQNKHETIGWKSTDPMICPQNSFK